MHMYAHREALGITVFLYHPLPCGFETESLAESEAYLDDQLDQSKERF